VEAQILEAIGVDFIDESEVLTPADETHHINKHNFKVPVLCGCRNLGEALRRISEARARAKAQGCAAAAPRGHARARAQRAHPRRASRTRRRVARTRCKR